MSSLEDRCNRSTESCAAPPGSRDGRIATSSWSVTGSEGSNRRRPWRISRAGRNIRKRSQPGVRDTDDFDALQLLQIVDGRQDGVIQRPGFAIGVNILHSVAEAGRRVAATGFEQAVDQGLVLKFGTIDDQGEVKSGHVTALLPFSEYTLFRLFIALGSGIDIVIQQPRLAAGGKLCIAAAYSVWRAESGVRTYVCNGSTPLMLTPLSFIPPVRKAPPLVQLAGRHNTSRARPNTPIRKWWWPLGNTRLASRRAGAHPGQVWVP